MLKNKNLLLVKLVKVLNHRLVGTEPLARHKGTNLFTQKLTTMAHGQRTRYDYRNDYKGMNLEELKEQADKTLDRMLDFLGLDNKTAHDFGKRNSYIKQLIAKIENKK